MRMIKGFLFVITGLFIMITLVSLFIPSRVIVVRGVEVNANSQKVFDEIRNFHNWHHWQPVFKADPAKMRYSADSTTAGSFCEWESNGKKNKLLFTTMDPNRVTVSLSREGEIDVTNVISVLPLSDSNRVQVEWQALTRLKWYPWEKFYGIFIEKMTGSGYEDALNSLKSYVESH